MRTFYLCLIATFFSFPFHTSAQNTQIRYLSGIDKDHTINWQFYIDHGMNSGQWSTIAVPSNWETKGFGVYSYGRKQPDSYQTGIYRTTFSIPQNWKGKVVDIVFEGVMTDATVTVNGKPAGPTHQGGFYEFKYDISKLLHYGHDNQLEVTVRDWSANRSVNQAEREADFWIFGGIYRPVYLEVKPTQHIVRTAIDAKANGNFLANIYLQGIANVNKAVAQLYDQDGHKIGQPFYTQLHKKQEEATLQTIFEHVKTWTPEYPNLYVAEIELQNEDGQTVHTIRQRFGFRTVTLRQGDGFYVNGVKVMFKGVDRHSFWPESGRTTSKALSIQDVLLMKNMNMNAVRMSHYPPDKHFLDVCDSLGLFVLDELTGWQAAYDTEVGTKLVRELVIRDVNHPCIVTWDNGNEGGFNLDLDDDFWIYDPQNRPVLHPWAIFRGTDTGHYRDYDCCTGHFFHGREVFFPTEFLHGNFDGGAGAGLEDYWNLMRSNPLSAGGFIWDFADEGLVRLDEDGYIDVVGNAAPDGILGPHREKEGSFYAIKEIWSPVVIDKPFLDPGFIGILPVENRYFYTNLNQCTYTWKLVNFPTPNTSRTGYEVASSQESRFPDVAPGENTMIDLKLPPDFNQHDALYVTINDLYGREIFTYTWPIKSPQVITQQLLGNEHAGLIWIDSTATKLTVSTNNMRYVFDKTNGLLETVVSDGKEISFRGGPVLATGETTFLNMNIQRTDTGVLVNERYEGAFRQVLWEVLGDGLLQLHTEYLPRQGSYDYLGINFNYPENKITGVKWLGRGPYRVWKNRMKGMAFNVWQKDYNNTVTGTPDWDYPEFKGYHRNLYWAVIDNIEKPFTIYCASEDIFLRLFTPAKPENARNDNTDGKFPDGDISFMHGISPIGTKFKKPEQLGPQGQPNMVQYNRSSKNYECTLIFDFR